MKITFRSVWLSCLLLGATIVMVASSGVAISTAAQRTPLVHSSPACQLNLLGETRSSPAETAAWNKVFSDFKSRFHCSVVATWQGQWSGIPQLLNEARISHQTVDIVADGTYNYSLASAGDLMDLTKLVAPYKSRFPAATLQPFTVDGRLWAVPDEPETFSMFFYNVTLFKKLDLTVPRTFAQLEHDAQVIKSRTNVLPIVEGGSDAWEWPMWYMATFAQTSGNKSVPDTIAFLEGKQQFTSAASVQALEDIAQFSKDGLLTENALGTDENGAVAAFVKGLAAMMFDGGWDLPTIEAGQPKFSIGVFPFPLVVSKAGVFVQPNGSPSEGLAIPSSIPRADLPMAAQFLEFVSSPLEANKIQSTLDPEVPTITGVKPVSDPLSATLREYLPKTNSWLDWIWPADVVTSVENAIEGVLFSHQSAMSAAKSVQNELQTLRQEQNYNYDFWATWSKAQRSAVEPPFIPKVEIQK